MDQRERRTCRSTSHHKRIHFLQYMYKISSTLTYVFKNSFSWRKKKEKVPSSSSLMIFRFGSFSTLFLVSCATCLEAAKPRRPVEPSFGAVNLLWLRLPMFFHSPKEMTGFTCIHGIQNLSAPGEVSLTSLSLSTSKESNESVQAQDSKLNVHVIKGSLVANFRYTNFWVAGQE